MPIQWNMSLSTGLRSIDLQHQELIEIINELEAAHLAGESERALQDVLPRLDAYVLFHFSTEESMMHGKPECAEHVRGHVEAHRVFAARVAALRAQAEGVKQGGEAPATQAFQDFIEYLKSWLIDHILKTDRELAKALLPRPRA